MIVEIVSLLTLLLAAWYFWLIGRFRKGWVDVPECEALSLPSDLPKFSILIPARNEEANLPACLDDLLAQDYPATHFEVFVIDDFSEDGTADIVRERMATHANLQLLSLSEILPPGHNAYKKLGITEGIKRARFDWILTTDADCRRGPKHLQALTGFIALKNPVLVSAPVKFIHREGFFQQWQRMEFCSLVAIGGATMGMGMPTMCNGANLLYRKEAFHSVGGYDGLTHLASGDDELLMHRIARKFPDGVKFLKSREAMVETQGAPSLRSFIHQRKRWVSKSAKYPEKRITLTLTLVWLFNLCLWVCFFGGFLNPALWLAFALAFGLKLAAERRFFRCVLPFFREEKALGILFPASILQSLYVLFIGIYGNFGGYRWKGRKVR